MINGPWHAPVGPGCQTRRVTRPDAIAAAIDIGSYSTHLLVAEVQGRRLRPILDESAFLGLGRSIDEHGRIGPRRIDLVDTLHRFAWLARQRGATQITVAGTDPLRRAADAEQVVADLRTAIHLDTLILSHEEEALVALVGIQAGRPVTRDTMVIDVGGGSTEFLSVGPGREAIAVGLPLGVTRLTGAHIQHDPPLPGEIDALFTYTRATMAGAPPLAPGDMVAVGGTSRNLLRVGPSLANRVLTRRRLWRALELVTGGTAVEAADRWGIKLSRARVLSAGAAILIGALDHYRLDHLRVARGGLREGLILSAHRAGPAWRNHVRDLARGWER